MYTHSEQNKTKSKKEDEKGEKERRETNPGRGRPEPFSFGSLRWDLTWILLSNKKKSQNYFILLSKWCLTDSKFYQSFLVCTHLFRGEEKHSNKNFQRKSENLPKYNDRLII
jgi:hypothetical protein